MRTGRCGVANIATARLMIPTMLKRIEFVAKAMQFGYGGPPEVNE